MTRNSDFNMISKKMAMVLKFYLLQYIPNVFRHFAVANGFMTSVSYPQMVQGLQSHSNELNQLHDQTIMNTLTPSSSNRPHTASLSHFYHEIGKQPIASVNLSTTHNHLRHNDSLAIRSMANTIEII